MIKKLTLLAGAAVLALAVPTQSRAGDIYSYQPDKPGSLIPAFSGLYVGGYGGYSWNRLSVSGAAPNFNADGGDYGGFVGYSLNGLLASSNGLGFGLTGAIEGHYGSSNARDSKDIGAASITAKKSDEWGIDFRPGLTFVDRYTPFGLKPYGIIGYERTKYDAAALTTSGSAHYNGMTLGLGTEVLAYQHFGVRVDYQHVFYQDNNDIRPHEDDIRVGGVLHF